MPLINLCKKGFGIGFTMVFGGTLILTYDPNIPTRCFKLAHFKIIQNGFTNDYNRNVMTQGEVKRWEDVLQNEELLQAVQSRDTSDVATISSLRKRWSQEHIAIAIECIDAKERAKRKGYADAFVSDRQGIEQATSLCVATHKAKRFNSNKQIFDCCCGVGGDLLALPEHAVGVDTHALRCWMAEQNTGKTIQQLDVLTMPYDNTMLVHIDPARRTNYKRIFTLSEMSPSIEQVFDIASQVEGGCIKCSPAVNLIDFEGLQKPLEIEYIEERGALIQAAIWFGSLAYNPNKTTATNIDNSLSLTGVWDPELPLGKIDSYLYEPKPSIERACLMNIIAGELDAHELARGLGILSSTTQIDSKWLNAFEVIEVLPLRLEKVQSFLDGNECNAIEVKTRAQVIDPNEWQNKLRTGTSGETITLFALRIGNHHKAIVTRRIQRP